MADVRPQLPIKIVDPTTNTQEAGVDANGDLQVVIPNSIVPGTGATNLGKAEDGGSAGGDTLVGVAAVQDAALSALGSVDGDYTWLRVDANGALWTQLAAPGTAATDLAKAEDDPHATGDVGIAVWGVRQNTPTALAADGDYQPFIFDTNGRLHVTDPNAGSGSPTTPTVTADSASAIAAGTEDNTIQTADLGGNTVQLAGVDISSSVAFRAEINEVNDDVETLRAVLFGQSGTTIQWRPPHKAYFNVTFTANAGFDGWRCSMTNMDTSEAADLYATFYTED